MRVVSREIDGPFSSIRLLQLFQFTYQLCPTDKNGHAPNFALGRSRPYSAAIMYRVTPSLTPENPWIHIFVDLAHFRRIHVWLVVKSTNSTPNMISHIRIKNFRSIELLEIPTNYLTTFVGPNDAGKSNIVRALNLFFNGQTDHNSEFSFNSDFNSNAKVPARKAAEIEVTITIDLPSGFIRKGYAESISWRKTWRKDGEHLDRQVRCFTDGREFPRYSKIPNFLDRIVFHYVPAIKDKGYFTNLQGQLYEVLSTVAADSLRNSAIQFESEIQGHLSELLLDLDSTINTSTQLKLPQDLRRVFEDLEFDSNNTPLSRRGDGIKIRHIPMILHFLGEKENSILGSGSIKHTYVWAFEEPENNVELRSCFDMAEQFMGFIENESAQIFMTTHSPVFYAIPDPGGDDPNEAWITTYYVRKPEDFTELSTFNRELVDENLGLMPLVAPYVTKEKERIERLEKTISEIRKDKPVIFLEGRTDEVVVRKALSTFFPDALDNLYVYGGQEAEYGSAMAAANRAIA